MPKYSRRQIARGFASQLLLHPTPAVVAAVAKFLILQKMTRQVDLFVADVIQELFHQHRHLTVTITTARAVSQAITKSIGEKLRLATRAKTVGTIIKHDPAIIGGFIANTPMGELDASIRYKLNRLKATL